MILIIISKVFTYLKGGILIHVVRADEFNLTTLNETDKYVSQLSISARLNTKNVGDS